MRQRVLYHVRDTLISGWDFLQHYSYSDSKRSIANGFYFALCWSAIGEGLLPTGIPDVVFIGQLSGLELNMGNTVLQGYRKCLTPLPIVSFHSLLCSHHITSWPTRAQLNKADQCVSSST